MLKKKWMFTAVVLGIILIGTFLYIVINCTNYDLYISEPEEAHYTNVSISYSEPDIVSNSEPIYEDGYLKITFHSLKQGGTYATVTYTSESDNLKTSFTSYLKVGLFNIIYNDMGSGIQGVPNISGFPVYYISAALFLCIMTVYMIIQFKNYLKKNIYSYNTILNCGLMIIFAGLAVFFTSLSVYLLFNYRDHYANTIQTLTPMVLMLIVCFSTPFILFYAVSMTISNISLIRHEGFRVANALGIVISILMVSGTVTCLVLAQQVNFYDTISVLVFSVICSLVIFCEIYLLSTQICAFVAAKHKPEFDKDYIIILGCGIKKDGTLLPLLRGRVDKAIDFFHCQLKNTGKKAVFIPSGGQGSDEIISEGEAMKRYLLEQGIPEEQIMPETKSTNTLENMKFSKELIADSNAKVVFSTTNYHVFRSGILSNQAGLKAEGMGSKTKWYFWPNAFIREFIGLLVSQKKKIVILAFAAVLFALGMTLLTL